MKTFLFVLLAFTAVYFTPATAQTKLPSIKGKLFIIGGGNRSLALMKTLVATAAFGPKDYAVVLPMSSEEPDTSFYYFKEDFEPASSIACVNFNFTKDNTNNKNGLIH